MLAEAGVLCVGRCAGGTAGAGRCAGRCVCGSAGVVVCVAVWGLAACFMRLPRALLSCAVAPVRRKTACSGMRSATALRGAVAARAGNAQTNVEQETAISSSLLLLSTSTMRDAWRQAGGRRLYGEGEVVGSMAGQGSRRRSR